MENTPLISFIIPVYNVPAEMLCECLESIVKLSLRQHEREIILVDDGSQLSPLKAIGTYLDEIIYIRQKNGGLGSARNRGLQNATGQYIQFVDADDALITNQYEHCLDLARFQKPDMVMFNFSKKKDSHTLYTEQPIITGRYLMRHQNLKAAACAYLFKSTILGNLRFTPGIYHEDEEFTPLLVLRAETIIQTNTQAYYYRTREDSITTKTDLRSTLKRLNDFKGVIYHLRDVAAIIPGADQQALLRRIHQLTMDYIYKVIVDTQSKHYLNRRLNELRSKGLFPLPDRDYTAKYTWFRRLTTNSIGLAFLMRTLPLIKRE
jgi:glycosyltransferase involved in cell wall biosynthesis